MVRRMRRIPHEVAMNAPLPFAVGDELTRRNTGALAIRIKVTAINQNFLMADVLEGENKKDPLKVFRAGWVLYSKVQP